MGWFDDNHWAGEAYDFGTGYMARSGYSGINKFWRGELPLARYDV